MRVNSSDGNFTRASFGNGVDEGRPSPKRRSSVSVKLSKTSSARPVLYSRLHQEALLRLASIIQEGDNTRVETTHGKLPVEAAYIVMKRVTESAGNPIVSAGLSTFNKLSSLRTDPALTILKKDTWRGFFEKSDPNTNNRRPASRERGMMDDSLQLSRSTQSLRPINTQHHHSPEIPETERYNQQSSEEYELQNRSGTLLNELALIMVERIRGLWQKLKIPQKEQNFYEKSICSLPVQSAEQCKELSKLVLVLQLHEKNIKTVLQSIQRRELAAGKCFDVMIALARRFSNRSSFTGDSSDRLTELSKSQVFWKEELILSLNEVRSVSIEVIRNIQEWRRGLWRPLPFIWKGQDYLLKMKDDFQSFEKNETLKRILEMVPLKMSDLQGIVFVDSQQQLQQQQFSSVPPQQFPQQTKASTITPTFGRNSSPQRPITSGGGGGPRNWATPTPSSSSAVTHNNRKGGGGSSDGHHNDYIDSLLSQFQCEFDFLELQSAVTIVLEEESLQRAIALEERALVAKGVFIPILRPLHDRNGTHHSTLGSVSTLGSPVGQQANNTNTGATTANNNRSSNNNMNNNMNNNNNNRNNNPNNQHYNENSRNTDLYTDKSHEFLGFPPSQQENSNNNNINNNNNSTTASSTQQKKVKSGKSRRRSEEEEKLMKTADLEGEEEVVIAPSSEFSSVRRPLQQQQGQAQEQEQR
jgi:hypothetical protein